MQSEEPMDGDKILKLQFLEYILSLSDLYNNDENFGSDEKGNLIIIDFNVILNPFLLTFYTFNTVPPPLPPEIRMFV